MKQRFFHVLLATGLLLGLLANASCGGGTHKKGTTKAEREQALLAEKAAFKVGVLPTLDCLPIYLLKDSLLYDTAKADIRIKTFTAHMDVDTALVGGSVQVGVSDMVRAAFLGRQGHFMKAISATPTYWQLFTHPDEKIDSLSKLADKTIGMTRHSATDLLTEKAAKEGKLRSRAFPAQINDVNVRLKMLRNDQLEAAWLTEPQATQAVLQGSKLLVDNRKDSTRLGVLLYHENVEDDYSLRAQQLDAFKAAYNKACQLINQHGLAYYAALLKKYYGLDDKTIRALPKPTFEGIVSPRAKDVKLAKEFR